MALGSLLIARFTNALVKSRPLKDVGAQQVRSFALRRGRDLTPNYFQVMIDLQGVKACLLRFPQGMESAALSASYVMALTSGALGPNLYYSYARSVTKSTTQLETLLKIINSPTVGEHWLQGSHLANQLLKGSFGWVYQQLYPPHRRFFILQFPEGKPVSEFWRLCAQYVRPILGH